MEFEYFDNRISFTKELNKLDILSVNFSRILSGLNIKHVFLSGYIAILFGRNRSSEDIDVVCEKLPIEKFKELWSKIHEDLECIITDDADNAYNKYLLENSAIRFSYIGKFIPNIELKFVRTELHKMAIDNSITVELNEHIIPISPLEQQIAYKLYMSSEKDIEDARFLFKIFEKHLNKERLIEFLGDLKVGITLSKNNLGWSD